MHRAAPIALCCLTACFDPNAVEGTDTDASTGSSDATPTTAVDDGDPASGTMSSTATPTSDDTAGPTSAGPDTTVGDADPDSTGATGGEPPPMSACRGTHHDWFEASFEYPDGGIVGTADFPSSPWGTVAGAPTVQDGRLVTVGDSTVVASQGVALSIDGLRLRYTVIFEHSDNEAKIGFNADVAGAGGIGVSMRASDGEIALVEDGEIAELDVLGALEIGTEYFVEVELSDFDANVWVSTGNYATVPGSTVVLELPEVAVGGATDGRWVSAVLDDSGGESPAVDDVTLARCDVEAPEYEDVFVDTFNRPNSATVGNAEYPAASVWDEYTADASISINRLRVHEFSTGVRCQAAAAVGVDQARLRAVVSFSTTQGFPGVFWGVNGEPTSGELALGVFAWNNGDEGRLSLNGYGGGIETPFPNQPFVPNTDYYIEVAVDGNYGVATVRTASFTGPVYVATGDNDFQAPPAINNDISVENISTLGTFYFDEVRLSRYPAN